MEVMPDMAGFVKELLPRHHALDFVEQALGFPWAFPPDSRSLKDAVGHYLHESYTSPEDHPPESRSLRDGFVVRASDTAGASAGSPAFLLHAGEVPMGEIPDLALGPLQTAEIHTGGFLPGGSDAVVMLEDTARAAEWVEIRKGTQAGNHVLRKGEEMRKGEVVLERGQRLDYRSVGILATLGVESVPVMQPRIGLFSTGDEIVEIGTTPLPPGKIRDVNSWMLQSLLMERGFEPKRLGILPDARNMFLRSLQTSLQSFDVILISGGSSVSVRDFTYEILSGLPDPGLLVRGINISPGKPTLIGGCRHERKLVLGLPGHPLSCSVVALTLVLPLLQKMCGIAEPNGVAHTMDLPLGEDVIGRSGVEEFIPATCRDGFVFPLMAKSGYVGALRQADTLIRLDSSKETMRKGESVQLWPL